MTIIFDISEPDVEAKLLVMRWMFERRRAGHLITTAAIKRELLPLLQDKINEDSSGDNEVVAII